MDTARLQGIADALAEEFFGGVFAGYSSGLFLVRAEEGDGKDFLRRHLSIACKKSNCKVICFDLSETSKDPGEAVYVRVASELIASRAQQRRQLPYWVGKLLFRRMPGDIELRYGLAHTLSSQLELISAMSRQRLVLLIDGIDRMLDTESGRSCMYALKAARDHLTLGPGVDHIRMVFSGESKDALRLMAHSYRHPFYGAALKDLDQLHKECVRTPYLDKEDRGGSSPASRP